MASDGIGETVRSRRVPSLGMKLVVIGALAVLLHLGSVMTLGLVREREARSASAVAEIAGKWGGAQRLLGPVLTVPFTDAEGRILLGRFLPDELEIKGSAEPEIRYYGIFKTVVYTSKLVVSGRFTAPDMAAWQITPEQVQWQNAVIAFGISDSKGIRENLEVSWDGSKLATEPGTGTHGFPANGVSVKLPRDSFANGKPVAFSLSLQINGSESLFFHPLGKVTNVELSSPWAHPSFGGAFLPEKRSIDAKGFTAAWRILHHNRSYPQAWFDIGQTTASGHTQNAEAIARSGFGVEMHIPADHYQQVERSVKYGILFIGLTFMAFFATEIIARRRLHPVQYFMVGLAMTIFYVILLALAEHVGFSAAYLAAATGVVGLITAYSKAALAGLKPAAGVCGVLVTLYGFLFVTLRLQDYALLVGALGVFGALAVFMMVTRQVDWYEIG